MKIVALLLVFLNILFAEVYYTKLPPADAEKQLTITNYSSIDNKGYYTYVWNENNKAFIHFELAEGYEATLICNGSVDVIQDGINKDVYLWYDDSNNIGCETLTVSTTFLISSSTSTSELKMLDFSKDFSAIVDIGDGYTFDYKAINSTEYSNNVNTITKTEIDELSAGWHMIGTSYTIYDMSIFDSTKVVWLNNNDTWWVYSKTDSNVINSSFPKLKSIPAHHGFWVQK